MIYLFQELDLISNELLHQMIFSLPVARREYVQHFKLPEDQKRSALAWLLLRYGLKQEYGFREIPDFQKTSSGKPFFRGENMPFFNLSHSGNFVGCALHDREIGLDIQKLTEPLESLIRRVCTQEVLIPLLCSLSMSRISLARNFSDLFGEIKGVKYFAIFPFPNIFSYAFLNVKSVRPSIGAI